MWRNRFEELQTVFNDFFDSHIVPNEAVYYEQVESHRRAGNPWQVCPITTSLIAKAKEKGLWNLFLPDVSGVTQREYATLAERMGRVPCFIEVFNCDAPDTGNMETLHMYGTQEQKQKWLVPLLDGSMRSAFCMTEPQVASSDATNIECRATLVEDGKLWEISGTKWWSTGAGHPNTRIFIVMVRTDDDVDKEKTKKGSRHTQHSMLLVPRDTPGVVIKRALTVFGDDDAPKGHFEVSFTNVHVPVKEATLLGIGKGFEIAQGRLGPGRVHHCMRSIGMGERALELMIDRSLRRSTFGKRLAQHGVVQQSIARSRIELDMARLLILECASLLDAETKNNHSSKKKSPRLLQLIAMIKVVAPRVACDVIDRSIQVHGGKGLSQDSILTRLYAGQRSLRIADGPDEVHEMTVARMELSAKLKALTSSSSGSRSKL